MNSGIWFLVWFIVLVLGAVALYYSYVHFVPQSVQDKLVGWKTHIVGWTLTVFSFLSQVPVILQPYLEQLQTLGLEKYLPSEKQALFVAGIGLLVILCRLWAARGV